MEEEWKDIPELKGKYQVSNYGRVKSLKRTIEYNRMRSNGVIHKQTNSYPEKILKTQKDKEGYPHLIANVGYKARKGFKIHQLVWDLFNGADRTNLDIDHIDNNRKNNNINNLQLLSHRENTTKGYDKKRKYRFAGIRRKGNKYMSRIWIKGKGEIHLGSYSSDVEAGLAYLKAKLKYTGELGSI